MSNDKKFLANVDDDSDGAESDSERDEVGQVEEALVPQEEVDELEEDLNRILRENAILTSETLAEIGSVFYRHDRVKQTIAEDRNYLSIVYEGYSCGPLEGILLTSDKFEYAGSFAARTAEETGVTYRVVR